MFAAFDTMTSLIAQCGLRSRLLDQQAARLQRPALCKIRQSEPLGGLGLAGYAEGSVGAATILKRYGTLEKAIVAGPFPHEAADFMLY